MEPEKLKHLEFIQSVITRMNTNSFQIKGWAITIVSASLALYASTENDYFVLVGIFPSLIFWFLDAYYLTLDRRFRCLYSDAAGITNFDSNTELFSIAIEPYKKKESYCRAFWANTIRNLYLPIILMLTGIFIYLKVN